MLYTEMVEIIRELADKQTENTEEEQKIKLTLDTIYEVFAKIEDFSNSKGCKPIVKGSEWVESKEHRGLEAQLLIGEILDTIGQSCEDQME